MSSAEDVIRAREEAERGAAVASQAARGRTKLEELQRQAEELIPETLSALAAKGFPGGQLLYITTTIPGVFRSTSNSVEIAGWKVYRDSDSDSWHEYYLLSDGRILSQASGGMHGLQTGGPYSVAEIIAGFSPARAVELLDLVLTGGPQYNFNAGGPRGVRGLLNELKKPPPPPLQAEIPTQPTPVAPRPTPSRIQHLERLVANGHITAEDAKQYVEGDRIPDSAWAEIREMRP